jgi:hypothetical protein
MDERMLRGEKEFVQTRTETRRDYTLRPGSPNFGWNNRQRTLTIIGDFSSGPNRITDWVTWVQTENSRSSVTVDARADNFEAVRARFQPILNSYRLP